MYNTGTFTKKTCSDVKVRGTGGPSPQAATVFSVANQTVATVSSVGLVEAKQLGTTNLTGLVQAADPAKGQTLLYSKDVIIIHVVQLRGVKINVASTNLVTGTKISMYATGLNDETPFTFANAVPGLKFYWSSTNPDVCRVKSVYALSGVAVESENDFRVDLHCINPGQTTVRLRMEITDHRYQQADLQALFEDDVTFEVYERLQLIFPAAGFLLLPHNVNTKIRTNRDGSAGITYELFNDCSRCKVASISSSPAVVTVSKAGHVSSSSLSGTAVVLVTVHEEFGINQTAVVHVEVKTVSSLAITCHSPVRANSDKLQTFPLGMNVLFAVTLHDNIGRTFSVASVPLKYRLNRFDAVHVVPGPENGTFYARAMNLGEAILQVWDPSAGNIADYIRIRVGHGLTPTKATLLLGTVQQFSTSVISEGVGGEWSSSNSRVIRINATTGVAMAMAAGTATIYYKIPDLYSAQTEVKVESLTYIHITQDDSLAITNLPRPDGRGYIVPINLGHDQLSVEETSKMSGLGDGIMVYQDTMPFECILNSENDLFDYVNLGEFFSIQPGLISGKPMCYLLPRETSAEAIRAASTSAANLTLTVKVFDEIQGQSISSEPVTLPFVPAFVLSQTEVELSADRMEDFIAVTGTAKQLTSIQWKSLDRSFVDVIEQLRPLVYAQRDYKVTVVGDNPKSFRKVGVEFKSKLTGQRELAYVSYTAPYGGGVPVLSPSAAQGNQQCPPPVAAPPDGGLQGFFLALLSQTSAWIIGFSIFIGFLILALILCCSPRYRSGGPVAGVPSPSPYRGTPVHGSPYGHSAYGSGSGGTYSAGSYSGYRAAGDTSFRSVPQENDDTRRETLTTFRRTTNSSRTYLSDDSSQAPGGTLPLGRVSPSKSPGLFSVTQ